VLLKPHLHGQSSRQRCTQLDSWQLHEHTLRGPIVTYAGHHPEGSREVVAVQLHAISALSCCPRGCMPLCPLARPYHNRNGRQGRWHCMSLYAGILCWSLSSQGCVDIALRKHFVPFDECYNFVLGDETVHRCLELRRHRYMHLSVVFRSNVLLHWMSASPVGGPGKCQAR
jgi:hypothetical protein